MPEQRHYHSHTERGLKFTTPKNYFTKCGLQNIAVDDKTLFRRIKNYHTEETSSLTREVRDDKGGKHAPLRNRATDW